MNVPIAWRSKGQKHVTLSSSEAEYVSISEVVKEILFVRQVLKTLDIEVELPIKVLVDNVGAIQMSNNNVSGAATRHVNMRYHFVRELICNKIIEVGFIRSDENDADLMTKNLVRRLFEKYADKLVEEIPKEWMS